MYRNWQKNLILLVALALVWLVAIGGCGPTPEPEVAPEPTKREPEVTREPTASVSPEPEPTCIPDPLVEPVPFSLATWDCSDWPDAPPIGDLEMIQERPVFVRDEVILTGPGDMVKEMVRGVLGPDAQLQGASLELKDLLPANVTEEFVGKWGSEPVIELYSTGGKTTTEAVEEINATAQGEGIPVFADLNLVTGHPHIVAGSPHIVAGSVAGQYVADAQGAFWDQWALGDVSGIALVTQAPAAPEIEYTGKGVRVAVFDTSPFTKPGIWALPWATPTLTLCVTHLLPQDDKPSDTSDHGLFVSGLVNAVAPDSQIHLIQVLDGEALGTLYTLNVALHSFMAERLDENEAEPGPWDLRNTVLNFSLGFPSPKDLVPESIPRDGSKDAPYWAWMELLAGKGEYAHRLPLASFDTLVGLADLEGATIVAASGNDSTPGHAEDAHLPAAYPFVVGVAASNMDRGRACYSNRGDMAAPGGDPGGERNECWTTLEPNCDNGVISLAYRTSPCTGFACWAGTSFSAPLVSGQSALVHQELSGAGSGVDIPTEVLNGAHPTSDPDLGTGIANLR